MVYYRAVKFNISFVCKTEDGREVFKEEGRMVAMSPYDFVYKKFETKEEADALGDIKVWAKQRTDIRAEKEAKAYCGEGTIYADDWDSKILDTDEGSDLDKMFKPKPKVPQYILDQIKELERQAEIYERKAEKLREAIRKLKEEYGID